MVKAVAVVRGDSKVTGTITLTQEAEGSPTTVAFDVKGLEPSKKFGFHIHQFGDVSNGCISAGGHWNADSSSPHGAPENSIEKRHIGDLGNITSSEAGEAKGTKSDKFVSLFGSTSVIGRSIVVHAGEDDLGLGGHPDSLKTGNAGGRSACGIIGFSSA